MIKTISLKVNFFDSEFQLKWYKAQPYEVFLCRILKRYFCCQTHLSQFHTVQEVQRLSERTPPAFMQSGVVLPIVQSKVGFTENETEELKA